MPGAGATSKARSRPRQTIENITSIGPEDIQITKDGGSLVLSAEYSVKVPLFGNLSACMDFNPSSAKP